MNLINLGNKMYITHTKHENYTKIDLGHRNLYAYSKHYKYLMGRILASIQVPHPKDRHYRMASKYLVDRSWLGPEAVKEIMIFACDVLVIDLDNSKQRARFNLRAHETSHTRRLLAKQDPMFQV